MPDAILARLPNVITVFLGIFLEASPFLLVGVPVSSILDVMVPADRLARILPRNRVAGLLGGAATLSILVAALAVNNHLI